MKTSRFVITGARDTIPPKAKVIQVLKWADDLAGGLAELTHGCAQNVDAFVSHVAEDELGWGIHYAEAQWDEHGKVAGPLRNRFMLEGKCDCHPEQITEVRMVLAFHDDLSRSKGTLDCITQAGQMRIPVLYWGYEPS